VLAGLLLATLVVLGAGMVVVRRESELARLRSDFVAGVSHELRTPLAQVRRFAETLRLGRVRTAQERDRSLAIIEQESHRLTHLVENVLQFSRAERQAIRLALRPRVLDEEIAGAMAAFTPLAEARGVRLEACLEPHVRAMVDADALRQILLNLLDNAVKYGPQGQTVRVAMGRRGATAMITVEDQGPGVPSAERARVWDPYYRMDRDVESAVAGGGIGLAVVRELVHGHGGSVDIDSATPHGARFIVTLPALPEEPSETPDRPSIRESAPSETPA
jgi:signal transduction histidine kinase